MRKSPIYILLLLFVMLGCSSSPTDKDSSNSTPNSSDSKETRENGNALVEVSVDWAEVSNAPSERFSKPTSKAKQNEATDFGVRVVYLSENAVFSQSVENTNADTTQLVTLDIPTADSVAVFATAVNGTHVINMGVIRSTVLDKAETYNFTPDDFNWYAPSYGKGPDFESAESDTARVDKSMSRADIEFNVVNPFDDSTKTEYDNFIIKLNGSGGINEYKGDNVREYFAAVQHEAGIQDTTDFGWYPYMDGAMFNLPEGRYVVDTRGRFTVVWE